MSAAPTFFQESLATRALPHRYRRVGTPFSFLDSVGIIPILEFIYKGHTLLDAAREMDVPVTHLRLWIEEGGHAPQVEEAERISAEGFLSTAYHELRTADSDFTLRRAKEALKHAQFMASKKDRATYGGDSVAPPAGPSGVQYVFNIGSANPQELQLVNEVVRQTAPQTPSEPAPTTFEALQAPKTPPEPSTPEPETGPFITPVDMETLGPDSVPDYLREY